MAVNPERTNFVYPLHWLISKKVRQLAETRRHLNRLLNEQRDLLRPEAVAALQAATEGARAVPRTEGDQALLKSKITTLEDAATRWLNPYPSAPLRENVKEFVVRSSPSLHSRP